MRKVQVHYFETTSASIYFYDCTSGLRCISTTSRLLLWDRATFIRRKFVNTTLSALSYERKALTHKDSFFASSALTSFSCYFYLYVRLECTMTWVNHKYNTMQCHQNSVLGRAIIMMKTNQIHHISWILLLLSSTSSFRYIYHNYVKINVIN